ncbi:uncharacterized protein LOC124884451 isoform X2 [Girardinichthys multiradiatus]|uniref:uncharacterized protein LOC124884451 isoform X2 n=1 Tax=Girardinichthys multiradiatus TaxID=208333 RepID=UPI001FAC6EB8|nr:uncharacterized protein LOC124884451 isoform X2 [Girardinichthys multiradiatus]
MLAAMENVSPSALGDVHTGDELQTKPVGHQKKPAVLKTRHARQQVSPTPRVTSPAAGVEPVTPKKNAEATQDQVLVCDVPRSTCPGEATEGPVPEERDDGQRTQTLPRGQAVNPISCVCSQGVPMSLVPGTVVDNCNCFRCRYYNCN